MTRLSNPPERVSGPQVLDSMIRALRARGLTPIGPTIRDGAIVYDEIESSRELPIGWTDEQEPGRYRLVRRSDDARFGFVVGPQSWKTYLFPPSHRLWAARRTNAGFVMETDGAEPPRYAFIGVRACEISALEIQDAVFQDQEHSDPVYRERRSRAFVVAVNCGGAAPTCFCTSMGTGPEVTKGYDLALTEIIEEGRHDILLRAGSPQGQELLDELETRVADESDLSRAQGVSNKARAEIVREVEEKDELPTMLAANQEHPRWDEVAERCLACANCTMVCPTCFCSTVEDVTDLTGENAERWRRWDSCFTLEHSYIHGGSIRRSVRSRYRQWLTHKVGTWMEQFGTSGCVGCGRCLTWCPVGIDMTEELRALREPDASEREDEPHGTS